MGPVKIRCGYCLVQSAETGLGVGDSALSCSKQHMLESKKGVSTNNHPGTTGAKQDCPRVAAMHVLPPPPNMGLGLIQVGREEFLREGRTYLGDRNSFKDH